MTLFLLPVGLLFPTLCGWFAIALLERGHPVLQRIERWTLSVTLGITLTMYLSFLSEVLGLIKFTSIGLFSVQMFTALALGMLWMRCKVLWSPSSALPALPASPRLSQRARIVVVLLCVWTLIKLLGGFAMLTGTPAYEDDVYNNWNMRGKLFYVTQEYTLEYEAGNELVSSGGVNSYPITVPLFKTWLATLAGDWDEGLVNSIHMVWFLATLLLVYWTLRRRMRSTWALGGTYLLSSLPLYMVNATTPYADAFLSLHVFAALSLLYGALISEKPEHRYSFLRLGGLATALLIFTKNEALIMHLPVLLLLLFLSVRVLAKSESIDRSDLRTAARHYVVFMGVVLVPWVVFKLVHNLPFGNAKSVLHLTLAWQKGVATAIAINTFFEGNWALLFPLLLGLLFAARREAFRFPTALFTGYLFFVVLGQFPLYFFTGISTEAVNQTGYARGFVQLAPVAVTLLTLLASSFFTPRTEE
ncbi:hypothetical protein COU76_03305 [Candidatus Peregrinibacteria bacterium CG10_big_fil_rev_8_21_14_0_10_49_10]|nr:MAG: hypothetical protein COU76_03305 [Candidatus Peregrinibacteria bacterium CG10_big_fil_rev_8_21_14_0_10_49_10]